MSFIINKINDSCKYYTLNEFKAELPNIKNDLNGHESKFDYLHQFFVDNNIFDIITLSETSQKHTNPGFFTNVEINGYIMYSTPSSSTKGGTLVYVKSKYKVKERTDLNNFDDTHEATWIEIVTNGCKNIICCSLYRHPNETLEKYNKFLEYLETCFIKLSNENKEVYICGDFNIDLRKIKESPKYKKFFDLMSSYGLLPCITQPTRIAGNAATIIDNIFGNIYNNHILCGNILSDFSDHFSQFISIPDRKLKTNKITIFRRDYSNFIAENFRNDISGQNFENSYDDVNSQFKDFHSKLEACIEQHAPLKKLSQKEIKLEQKPWITADLRKMIRIRNKIFNRKKRQKNNPNVKRLYNLFRNRVVREMKKAEKNYFSNFFRENSANIKKQWEGIMLG